MEKQKLFETEKISKAVMKLAAPTIKSWFVPPSPEKTGLDLGGGKIKFTAMISDAEVNIG